MSRRKLGRMSVEVPDEETAGRYLVRVPARELYEDPASLSRLDSSSLFGGERPMELEVGCGTGEFLCALAAESPERNFAGVDLHLKSLYRGIEVATGAGLENVRFVVADFRQVYPLLADDSLSAVYLHFPDPGVKTRHRRRRIFEKRFLEETHRAVVEGGRMSLATDDEDYFREMERLIDGQNRWRKDHEEPHLEGFDPPVKSRFQRMWERRGRTVRRFELVNLPG